MHALGPQEQTHDSLLALLRRHGAPDGCYVLSVDRELDGTSFALPETLGRVLGSGMGTLISCVPGRLAYLETETMRERFLLRR